MPSASMSQSLPAPTTVLRGTDLHLSLVVCGYVADAFLDRAQAGEVSGPVEGVTPVQQQVQQVGGDLLPCHLQALCQVGKSVAIYHWCLQAGASAQCSRLQEPHQADHPSAIKCPLQSTCSRQRLMLNREWAPACTDTHQQFGNIRKERIPAAPGNKCEPERAAAGRLTTCVTSPASTDSPVINPAGSTL